jgi:hypothetical protein
LRLGLCCAFAKEPLRLCRTTVRHLNDLTAAARLENLRLNLSYTSRPKSAATAVRMTPHPTSTGTRSAGQLRMIAQLVSSYVP